MTIDDDNSIYVGGLPYDATEESVRRAFDLYGAVVAVKIINDRHIGGKCYGFVTFTNPRSAIDAINDMDGRTIGGRVVKVNEVRSRGGRPGHMHERFRENERDMDWNRDRDRGRFQDHDRERYRDRNNDRSREWDHDHRRDDRKRDRDSDQGRDQERHKIYDRDWQKDSDTDWDQDRSMERFKDYERNDVKSTDEKLNDRFGSSNFAERRTREHSISSGESPEQVKDKLEVAVQRRDDLQSEIAEIDEKLEKKQLLVADLHEKSQKLEDSLASAKKLFFYRDMQLMKLQKCFLQVKDCKERLKSYEQELQSRLTGVSPNSELNDVPPESPLRHVRIRLSVKRANDLPGSLTKWSSHNFQNLVDTAMLENDDVATAPVRDVSV
ncbi:unnamed protein product [Victoria cruziana]